MNEVKKVVYEILKIFCATQSHYRVTEISEQLRSLWLKKVGAEVGLPLINRQKMIVNRQRQRRHGRRINRTALIEFIISRRLRPASVLRLLLGLDTRTGPLRKHRGLIGSFRQARNDLPDPAGETRRFRT